MNIYGSSYLVLEPNALRKMVKHLSKEILEIREKDYFDAIAVTGVSGISIGFPLSMETGIPVFVVRKEKDLTHGREIEGSEIFVEKYLILDDLISSGETINRIILALQNKAKMNGYSLPICTGIVTYNQQYGCSMAIEDHHFKINDRIEQKLKPRVYHK